MNLFIGCSSSKIDDKYSILSYNIYYDSNAYGIYDDSIYK